MKKKKKKSNPSSSLQENCERTCIQYTRDKTITTFFETHLKNRTSFRNLFCVHALDKNKSIIYSYNLNYHLL